MMFMAVMVSRVNILKPELIEFVHIKYGQLCKCQLRLNKIIFKRKDS